MFSPGGLFNSSDLKLDKSWAELVEEQASGGSEALEVEPSPESDIAEFVEESTAPVGHVEEENTENQSSRRTRKSQAPKKLPDTTPRFQLRDRGNSKEREKVIRRSERLKEADTRSRSRSSSKSTRKREKMSAFTVPSNGRVLRKRKASPALSTDSNSSDKADRRSAKFSTMDEIQKHTTSTPKSEGPSPTKKGRIVSSSTDTRRRLNSSPERKPFSYASAVTGMCLRSGDDSRCNSSLSSSASSTKSSSSRVPKYFPNPDQWEEPKLGWCTDDKVLQRRTREIKKAKEKPVYERYLKAVPKKKRVEKVHPRTPNKSVNYSRRSWDTMLRKWKRSLYEWAGEDPSESCASSFVGSDSDIGDVSSEAGDGDSEQVSGNQILSSLQHIPEHREEASMMASLLGHFDLDSRRGFSTQDEATLGANSNEDSNTLTANGNSRQAVQGSTRKGQIDFSKLTRSPLKRK